MIQYNFVKIVMKNVLLFRISTICINFFSNNRIFKQKTKIFIKPTIIKRAETFVKKSHLLNLEIQKY